MLNRDLIPDAEYIHVGLSEEEKEEYKKQPDEHKTLDRGIYIGLNLFTLVFGTLMDTLQFTTGLKDIRGKLLGFIPLSSILSRILGLLYLTQAVPVNRKFTEEGIDRLIEQWKGQALPEWEKLSRSEELKANVTSGFLNTYALFSDAAATAYYLEQEGYSANRILNFFIGFLTASAKIPTESLETHLLIRSYFSKARQVAATILTDIHKLDIYKNMTAKREFDAVWAEFANHLKIALLNPANQTYLEDGGKLLATQLTNCFTQDQKILTDFLIELHLDPKISEDFAKQFSAFKQASLTKMNAPEEKAAPQQTNSLFQPLFQMIDVTIKTLLKVFGTLEDMTESYTAVAAILTMMLNVTPATRVLLFILSAANGLNDLSFNGKNSVEAIDLLKESISQGNYNSKKILRFIIALFTGALVGHAQFGLILSELKDPDAPLPPPLPHQLPEKVSLIQATGAALREFTLYTRYFEDAIQGLISISRSTTSFFTGKEKEQIAQAFNEIITEAEEWLIITMAEEENVPQDSPPPYTAADTTSSSSDASSEDANENINNAENDEWEAIDAEDTVTEPLAPPKSPPSPLQSKGFFARYFNFGSTATPKETANHTLRQQI